MGFGTYLANGFKALLFQREAVLAIADDPAVRNHGLLINAILALVGGVFGFIIGMAIESFGSMFSGSPVSMTLPLVLAVVCFIVTFIIYFGSAGISHLLARAFGGLRESIFPFYGTILSVSFALAIVSIPIYALRFFFSFILSASPVIGVLGTILSVLLQFGFMIFSVIVIIFVIREVHVLSTARAFLVWFIPVAVFIVIIIALFAAFMAPYLGAISQTSW